MTPLTMQEIEAIEDDVLDRYDREDDTRRIRTAQIKAELTLIDRMDREGVKRKDKR